jgi:hypothetical protein
LDAVARDEGIRFARRHKHLVAHPDRLAVALPEGFHQFRVLLALLGMQPLLELVEHDENLLATRGSQSASQGGNALLQAMVLGQSLALPS